MNVIGYDTDSGDYVHWESTDRCHALSIKDSVEDAKLYQCARVSLCTRGMFATF